MCVEHSSLVSVFSHRPRSHPPLHAHDAPNIHNLVHQFLHLSEVPNFHPELEVRVFVRSQAPSFNDVGVVGDDLGALREEELPVEGVDVDDCGVEDEGVLLVFVGVPDEGDALDVGAGGLGGGGEGRRLGVFSEGLRKMGERERQNELESVWK